MPRDLRAQAIVLRRTNYGESDRILNFITPTGKVSALARGVRKEKSRLAGGIELFSVADIVVHQGSSDLGILTSTKMLHFYSGILADMSRLELASACLKRIERAAQQVDSPEHFSLLLQIFQNLDHGISLELATTWFNLNLHRTSGEELNLIYDISGAKLSPEIQYYWDTTENALRPDITGRISAPEIKLARFLLSNKLALAAKIDQIEQTLPPIYELSKTLA